MALAFNAGTDKQLVVTKFGVGSYGKQTVYTDYRNCGWPMETPVPFNIVPFVNEFIGDNTKTFFTLMKRSGTSRVYGIRVTQQNDVIKVYFSSTTNNSTYTDHIEAATFTVNSIPSSYSIYFGYNNFCDSTGWGMWVFTGQVYLISLIDMQISGHNEVVEDTATLTNLNQVPISTKEPTRPYNYNLVYITPTLFADQPLSVIRGMIMSSGTFDGGGYVLNLSGSSDMSNFTDASDNPPSPYVPPSPDDPNDEGTPSGPDGGDGDHDPTYDPIPIPAKPTQGAATSGFVTLYKLHQAAMSQWASDMFASSVWEAIKLFFSNPMDFMIGVNLLPFEPTAGTSYKPKFGAVSFTHAYPSIANQYVDVDCGSVNITKYWGSCFDYEPYTKIQIWLPYIGYRDLPVDEIMGSTLSVKYRCDCLTGDCVAFVYVGTVGETGPQVERVIAQFYGNCAVRIPFASVSYDSAISNSIQLMGAAATSGLSAGAGAAMETGGAYGGLIAGVKAGGEATMNMTGSRSSAIGVVQGLKPNIQKGGAAGASTGYMSIQKPYLIRRIPRQSLPDNYMNLKGYPSNIGGKLSDFTGLAVVDDIQLNNIPAMEGEREEIISWLRGGVLL